ncbi:MAG TPA: hypothetical protein VFX89_03505 [Gammaproteobacteria bacterium]|nr:hypothetical protein [Gammaproteobacteria bacterium]
MRLETRNWSSAICLAALGLASPTIAQVRKGAEPWTPALTADGQPNIQGDWTNDTYTPLERPAELAGKELFTREEALAYVKSRTDRLEAQAADDIHYDDAIWQAENYGKVANLRTSLIVEPRDGKVPPLTAAGKARHAQQLAAQRAEKVTTGAASRSLAERCISWGNVGPPMVPPTYSANLEILQTADAVIIRHELMHDVRIVYLDGRPHPGAGVQWLAGHSIGRWEGPTLVVDTTNFTDKTNFRGSPQNTRQDIFATEHLHVVERFTPTSPDTMRYEFTVDDPTTWTSPWSGEMEIRRTEGPIYEYACHEGNYGLANILRGAAAAAP